MEMANISKEFLESLPDDRRDSIINNMLSTLCMNPSQLEEKFADNIRSMYRGFEGITIKCTFCRKDEPEDKEFGECAGCGTVLYCSKECQRKHWKIHKIECGKGDGADKNKKAYARIRKFDIFYKPFIRELVLDMYRLFNKEMDAGNVLFPEDFIADIVLADLPSGTKRPRLYIKRAIVGKLQDNEKEDDVFRYPPERGCQNVRYCLSYQVRSGENKLFLGSHVQFQHIVDQDELRRLKNTPKKVYEENVSERQQMINDIARGEDPKTYKVINEIMKERSS